MMSDDSGDKKARDGKRDSPEGPREREVCRWYDVALVRSPGLACTLQDFEGQGLGLGLASSPSCSVDKPVDSENGNAQVLVRLLLQQHPVRPSTNSNATAAASAPAAAPSASAAAASATASSTALPEERAISLAIQESLADANAGQSSWVRTIWNMSSTLEYVQFPRFIFSLMIFPGSFF